MDIAQFKPLKQSPRMPRGQQGFTLIEIMVVVVILGILAAMVVPKVLDRPDQARATAAKQDIPRPMIDELVRIFANDVDFQRPVAGGSSRTNGPASAAAIRSAAASSAPLT